MLTLEIITRLWPHADQHIAGLAEGIVRTAPIVFPKYGLTSDLLIAHAMAQFSEECGAGLEMAENMNYSAQRLREVFPTHFSASMAANAAHNPQMIAEIAYGGRMGNAPPPSTDGWVFRGQGLSQCTGRDEYAALGKTLGVDLVANPEWLTDPDHALECGVADFIQCGCLPYAEKDDVVGVTRRLNGGTNGLADREAWLRKWKAALAGSPAVPQTVPELAPATPAPVAAPPVAAAAAPSAGAYAEFIADLRALLSKHAALAS